MSYALMAQGRLAEAEQTCREAILLDPLVTVLWYNLGRLAVAAGRYQDAEQMFRKGLEMQPHAARFHTYLAALDILQKNPTAALQQAQLEPDDFWREYALTLVQQTQPDRAAADTALKNFSANTRPTVPTRLPLSTLFAKNRTRCFDGSTTPMPPMTRA